MKTIFNIIMLALLVPAVRYCNGDLNGRHTKTKKVNKTYNVSATDMLTIDNSYGNVDISTWNRREHFEFFSKFCTCRTLSRNGGNHL